MADTTFDPKKFLGEEALAQLVVEIKSGDAAVDAKVSALENGQVKTNKEAIEKLNGDTTTEGSVAKAIADAQSDLQGDIDEVSRVANQNKADIEAINHTTTGILAKAKEYADGEVAKVQGNVDTLSQTHATDKAALEAADNAINDKIGTVDSGKTVVGLIEEAQSAVNAEKNRAEGVEAGLESRLKAVEDDYLKDSDKEELQGNINTLTGVVETLRDGIDAEKVDGVMDLVQYVEDHGPEVTGMKEDIAANAGAIAAEEARAKAAEEANATAAANAQSAAETAQGAVEAEAARAAGVEGGLDTRLQAVEAAVGESGSVADDIEAAKDAAIEEANKLNNAMNTRVEALEAIDHDHSNKTTLDDITDSKVSAWDAAAAKAHEHSNKTVLDGITADKVTAWDGAEAAAIAKANELNTAMNARVAQLEAIDHDAYKDYADQAEADANAYTNAEINKFSAITREAVIAAFA